jgi:hypothetical protein
VPVLKSIYGTENGKEKQLTATFLYPGNVIIEANEGDQIPGGYKVSKIFTETNKVEIIKGKDKIQVGFSTLIPAFKQSERQVQPGISPYIPGMNRR